MIKTIGVIGAGQMGSGIAPRRAPDCYDRVERGESHDA